MAQRLRFGSARGIAALRRHAEVNPLCFQPFGGYGDETNIANGAAIPPEMPGIGFETKPPLRDLLATLVDV